MGNCCTVEGAIDHWIYVKTGDRKGSGTDANVRAILYDDAGEKSPEINLDCYVQNDGERGNTDVFQAPPLKGFGAVSKVELWRDNTDVRADWFCEVVIVNDRRTNRWFYFPVQRWMAPQRHYVVRAYDTSLPQLDDNRTLRENDLKERRLLYQYDQRAPDLPVQIRNVPADELFSDVFKWDIIARKNALLANTSQVTRAWSGLADLSASYTYPFEEPMGIDNWSNDVCFGAQRLIGCNPGVIRRCTELPENMGVTAEMLQPFLEGWTLRQIIQADRLFIVDLRILEDLPTKNDNRLCAPLGLFFVNGDRQLLPVAIQLYQQITPDNPVFLPNDPPFTWLLAKMWFNNADATVHLCLSNIGFTNLLMEGACVAMHRHLSSSHPVFRLLAPHFLFLIGINACGLDKLMAAGAWIDNCTTVGREGLLELIRRGIAEWRIDVNGTLPQDLKSRGVSDPNILPYYGYRDDGLLHYHAIESYVRQIVEHYYDAADKFVGDWELQNWGRDLALSKEQGGIGINGMPHEGKFKRVGDLVLVCTSLIFTCSVQHAAVNASQYDEYAFPPNYPIYLAGQPPIDRLQRTEEDLVAALPDKASTIDTMAATKLLSSATGPSLGEWTFQYQYDPPAIKAEKQWREELQKISKTIQERNFHRPPLFKYGNLDPSRVPSSICI